MRFCSSCGAEVTLKTPEGDNLPRHVCEACGTIHYENPKVVVGALPEWEDRILLCRRAIEPRHGFWTVPAGFMENRETTADAAARETEEEARARIEVGALYSLVNISHISQVHLFYRARLLDLDFGPGPESLEVRLFSEAEIPLGRYRVQVDTSHPAPLLRGPATWQLRFSYRRSCATGSWTGTKGG